jgi:hypothetical protein
MFWAIETWARTQVTQICPNPKKYGVSNVSVACRGWFLTGDPLKIVGDIHQLWEGLSLSLAESINFVAPDRTNILVDLVSAMSDENGYGWLTLSIFANFYK